MSNRLYEHDIITLTVTADTLRMFFKPLIFLSTISQSATNLLKFPLLRRHAAPTHSLLPLLPLSAFLARRLLIGGLDWRTLLIGGHLFLSKETTKGLTGAHFFQRTSKQKKKHPELIIIIVNNVRVI